MMRSIARPSPLAQAAILLAVLATVASCATSTPTSSPAPNPAPAPIAGSSQPTQPPAPTQATPSSHPLAPATGTACASGAWHSAPLNVTRDVATPPVPLVANVRTAPHPECGYDRFVLTFTGPVPGYYIRHVTQVLADPSGKPINLPGRSYLLITLRPAQAHTDSGTATITRGVHALDYRILTGYALEGDFEGVINLALGLNSTASFRAGELPGRLYVDLTSSSP